MKNPYKSVIDESLTKLLNGPIDHRLRAGVLLAVDCGLRLREILKLNVSSYLTTTSSAPHSIDPSRWGDGPVKLIARNVYVSNRAADAILACLPADDLGASPLLSDNSGSRLTSSWLTNELKLSCKKQSLDAMRFSSFRSIFVERAFASQLPARGSTSLVVYDRIGTVGPVTRYIKVSSDGAVGYHAAMARAMSLLKAA